MIASLLAAYSAGGYAQIIPGMERGAVCESEKGVVTAGDWIADYVETQNKGLVDDGWLLRETKAWELSLCDGSWGHKLDQKQCVELAAKWERPFVYAPNYVPDGCPIPVTPKCSSILDEREIKSFFFVMNLDGVWKTGKYVEGVCKYRICFWHCYRTYILWISICNCYCFAIRKLHICSIDKINSSLYFCC